MSILKSKYTKLKDIPKWAREANLYQQQDSGEYVFRIDQVEGATELAAPGLTANRDAFRDEKDEAIRQRDAAVQRAEAAEKDLSKLRTPGSVVLSPDDTTEWNAMKALGTSKEISKKLDELKDAKVKIENIDASKARGDFAKAAGINETVFDDWLSSDRGEGITKYFTKEELVKDEKTGKEEKVQVPYLTLEKQVDGKTKTEDVKLETYAKTVLPVYQYEALQKVDTNESGEQTTTDTKDKKKPFYVPAFDDKEKDDKSEDKSSTKRSEGERPVDFYNENRSTGKSPFAKN